MLFAIHTFSSSCPTTCFGSSFFTLLDAGVTVVGKVGGARRLLSSGREVGVSARRVAMQLVTAAPTKSRSFDCPGRVPLAVFFPAQTMGR